MNILAYAIIVGWIVFLGGLFAHRKDDEDEKYNVFVFLFFVLVALVISSVGLALGTLGVLPEVTW